MKSHAWEGEEIDLWNQKDAKVVAKTLANDAVMAAVFAEAEKQEPAKDVEPKGEKPKRATRRSA